MLRKARSERGQEVDATRLNGEAITKALQVMGLDALLEAESREKI
jgi:hypothetical protein